MIKISVIIPIYNSESFLPESLSSLSAQKMQDAEFICVNDGSTDESESICEQYAEKDSRFAIYNKTNGGAASARNFGIQHANGEYIAFMDSDDCMIDSALDTMYEKAVTNNADILVHGAFTITVDEAKCPKWIEETVNVKNKKIKKFRQTDIFTNNGCRPFLWLHLIKTSIIKENGLCFNEKIQIGEDQAFQFAYFKYARKVTFIEDKLYGYRIGHGHSLMTFYSNKPAEKLENHLLLIENVQHDITPTSLKGSVMFTEWSLELVFWSLINLLYYDQAKYSGKILALLEKWNYKKTYPKLSRGHQIMADQIILMDRYGSKPSRLYDEIIALSKNIGKEYDKCHSSIIYRMYHITHSSK